MCVHSVGCGEDGAWHLEAEAGCSDVSAPEPVPSHAPCTGLDTAPAPLCPRLLLQCRCCGDPWGCWGEEQGSPQQQEDVASDFSFGADAIAEQLWPSDRKSGRWFFPSAVIYGMVWPQAAALEMGWGGSKLLPLLAANNAFWKAIPAVPVPDASPGNPCLQPEDA